MSVYCTWLMLAHPDQRAAELAAAGRIRCDYSRDREIGSPYVYQGSHVVPAEADPRGGSLEIGSIPNFLHHDADQNAEDLSRRVEFIRIGITEDSSTYHGGEPGDATVVLDRRQVTELRDTLTQWLNTEERW
jgi:hypothetical protein